MLDDKDEFEVSGVTLEYVRVQIDTYRRKLARYKADGGQYSGTEMIVERLVELEKLLEGR